VAKIHFMTEKEQKETLSAIRECTYFQNMNDEELQRLVSISDIKTYEKNSIIFFQLDEPKYMHILLEGNIRIYKSKPSGGEVQLMTSSAVTSIAELACFEKIPYPANCVTLTTSRIMRVPFEIFEKEFLSNPTISYGIIKSLSLKLRSLSNLVERELTLTSEQKVAKYIVEHEDEIGNIKQITIASELNITPETLSRMLKKLHKQGLVESTSPLIIQDIDGLKEIYDLF